MPFPTVQAGAAVGNRPAQGRRRPGRRDRRATTSSGCARLRSPTSRRRTIPGPKPTSLLYKILRQSVILDYADLADAGRDRCGRGCRSSQVREAEIVAVRPARQPPLPPLSSVGGPGAAVHPEPAPDLGGLPRQPRPARRSRPSPPRRSAREPRPPGAAAHGRAGPPADRNARRLQPSAGRVGDGGRQRPPASARATGAGHRRSPRRLRLGGRGAARRRAAPMHGAELADAFAARQRRAQTLTDVRRPARPRSSRSPTTAATSTRRRSPRPRSAAVLRNGYMTHKGTRGGGPALDRPLVRARAQGAVRCSTACSRVRA